MFDDKQWAFLQPSAQPDEGDGTVPQKQRYAPRKDEAPAFVGGFIDALKNAAGRQREE